MRVDRLPAGASRRKDSGGPGWTGGLPVRNAEARSARRGCRRGGGALRLVHDAGRGAVPAAGRVDRDDARRPVVVAARRLPLWAKGAAAVLAVAIGVAGGRRAVRYSVAEGRDGCGDQAGRVVAGGRVVGAVRRGAGGDGGRAGAGGGPEAAAADLVELRAPPRPAGAAGGRGPARRARHRRARETPAGRSAAPDLAGPGGQGRGARRPRTEDPRDARTAPAPLGRGRRPGGGRGRRRRPGRPGAGTSASASTRPPTTCLRHSATLWQARATALAGRIIARQGAVVEPVRGQFTYGSPTAYADAIAGRPEGRPPPRGLPAPAAGLALGRPLGARPVPASF